VKFLATLPKANTVAGNEMVTYLDLPPSLIPHHVQGREALDTDIQLEKEFLSSIRNSLAQNIPVVVKGWQPELPMEFNIQSFQRMGRHLDQPVQFQGHYHDDADLL
jgi:hypothetical protein